MSDTPAPGTPLDDDAPTIPVSKPPASIPRNDVPDLPLPEELTALLPPGAYHVESFLGQGGMGAVYKGVQVRLKRPVAIKIMRRDQGRDYGFEQRFEREAQAMAKLNHPNIVSVIDFGEAGPDYLYIVMELIDGADLMDVIRTGRMTQEMALILLPQICDALQFAHDHGIVHRDIKPSNIMLTRDGRVKMADFGLAKRFDVESSFRTQTGTSMGTPDYAAPEQFDTHAQIDHRADIYALGVMIYQMITGQLPRGVWKPPSQRAEIAPEWDDIVAHAMQADPKDRYQKASEIKTDVSRITPQSVAASAKDVAEAPEADRSRVRKDVAEAPHGKEPARPRGHALASAATKSRAPLLFGLIVGAAVIAIGAFFALRDADNGRAAPSAATEPWRDWLVEARDKQFFTERFEEQDGRFVSKETGGLSWEYSLKARDMAMRATWTPMDAPPLIPEVQARVGGGRHYAARVANGKAHLSERRQAGGTTSTRTIQEWPLPAGFDPKAEQVLELRVVDDLLTVRLNGQEIGSARDGALTQPGTGGAFATKGTAIRKLEYLNLDKPGASAAPNTGRAAVPPAAANGSGSSNPEKAAATPNAVLAGASSLPSTATKDAPFINTLGMKFVPVPITDGPTDGQRVLFSVWETRVQDYATFVKETKREWEKPDFAQGPTHPVVLVNYDDTHVFCAWLTDRERKAGKISMNEVYRLPSDHEWSCAAGLGELEDAAKTPAEKSLKIKRAFVWGGAWPPTDMVGNYAGEELRPQTAAWDTIPGIIDGYRDGFVETSPVGSFPADRFGLFDLGGNVWEWCVDWFDTAQNKRVLRGASWLNSDLFQIPLSNRGRMGPSFRNWNNGFRIVLGSSTRSVSSSPNLPSSRSFSAIATKDAPFVNTLGMKFVPVPITGGPTNGQRVLFSMWETRVQDYEAFAKEAKREWNKPEFEQSPTHPAIMVNWEDATAFCIWLTDRERKAGKLAANEVYRLPSDHEWSCAVGIGDREEAAKPPVEKNGTIAEVFPWDRIGLLRPELATIAAKRQRASQ